MGNELINRMIEYYNGDPKRIQHFIKVYSFARIIGEDEKLDMDTLKILTSAAIVHDIGIKEAERLYGYNNGKLQEQLGPSLARDMLTALGYSENVISRICYLVGHHHTYSGIAGPDYQILVEADFLVNAYEDNLNNSAKQAAYKNIFKTPAAKKIFKEMYSLQ